MTLPARTRVAIIGAGPAGLVLSHLLHRDGIDAVVLEDCSREHVEHRQRAGMLEQGTIDVLRQIGARERLDREGMPHEGVELRFDGRSHRVDFMGLVGREVMIYAQTEIVQDLIALRVAQGEPLEFETEALSVEDLESDTPVVRYRRAGEKGELRADVVIGADGFHGVSRRAMPASSIRFFEHQYPYAWLGITADVAPSCHELIYARHERGFALHSMRTPHVSRLYLQVPPDTDAKDWSDDQIWEELSTRFALADGSFTLARGPITDRGVTPMHSFVTEPMRHGRLFLAGDAAHIVPPTGAKGLNLAVADAQVLAAALGSWFTSKSATLIDAYSANALARAWRAQNFSTTMTTLMHPDPSGDPFAARLALSQLEHVATVESASRSLADNYTGLPLHL